jgi:hypothetical protein
MVYSNNFGQTRVGVRIVTQVVNAVDADATAFIAAAGITDLTQAAAISTLVDDLKTYGIWSKMKALYPFVGGSATSHKFNLKDPRDLDAAYRLVFNGGWVHSSTGAKPNGTTGYADTKLIPSANYPTVWDISIGFYSRTNIKDTITPSTDISAYQNNSQCIGFQTRYTDDKIYSQLYRDAQPYNIVVTNTDSSGLFTLSRTSTGSLKQFRNSTILGTSTATIAGSIPTTAICLSNGGNNTSYSSREQAFAFIGNGLSDTEATNFYTSVQKFNTTLGRQVGTPYVSDSDAQAFLNAASITDTTQSSAINTLVTDLKAAGIWTKMKALYPFVGGTASSHKFNLKDPRDLDVAFRLQFNGGWTHSATGALPNGSNAYADTYLIPNTTLSTTNFHLSFYSRTISNAATTIYPTEIGSAISGTQLIGLFLYRPTNPISKWGGEGYSTTAEGTTTMDSKYFGLTSRTNSTSLKYYKNGSVLATQTGIDNGNRPNIAITIGRSNGLPNYSDRESAFASIGDGLSDTEAANFYTAVQKFQTTLGRQVDVPLVSDSDAQSFLNAAGITSYTQANAVNTLVTDLKSGGLWTKMKALYPMVGGTSTSHKWNLKDPRDTNDAYRLSFSGGWTHGSTGAKPNGTNAYADTFIVPKNVFNSTTFEHVGYYSRTNTTLTTPPYRYDLGVDNYDASGNYTGGLSMIIRRDTNATLYSSDYGTLATYRQASTTTSDSLGFFLGSQTGTNIKLYKNNTILSTNTGVSNASYNMLSNSSTRSIWIGTMNELNYTTQNRWTDKETGLISIGEGLNDSEASLLYTAVQKFNTSLGRQVGTPVYNNGLVLNLDAGNANSYPGTGTTWFDLASGNNGTLVNGPTYDINNGGSLSFSTNKYVTIPTGDSYNFGTTDFTIEGWVNFNSISTNQIFVSKFASWTSNLDFVFRFNFATPRIEFMAGDLSAIGLQNTYNITANTWYNYCVSRVSGVTTLYLNGIAQMSHTGSVNIPNDKKDIRLGYAQDNSEPLNGRMSGFKVYNRGLSSTEILNNFNSTRGRFGL